MTMTTHSRQNPYSRPDLKFHPLPVEHRRILDALIATLAEYDRVYGCPPWRVSYAMYRQEAA